MEAAEARIATLTGSLASLNAAFKRMRGEGDTLHAAELRDTVARLEGQLAARCAEVRWALATCGQQLPSVHSKHHKPV